MTKLLSIRLVAILVGLGFAVVALYSFVVGAYAAITEEAPAHLPYEEPRDIAYSFDGPFGKWDVQQLQRGFKVYNEVCSACHSLKFVAFRDLEQIGYDEGQVKAFAASKQVPGIDPNTGEAIMRPGEPTDYFPSPYPNAVAAAAANKVVFSFIFPLLRWTKSDRRPLGSERFPMNFRLSVAPLPHEI